jgi:zona occludens toxin
MLIFHEGRPGSGKSYEAAINRIIPALKSGRKVYAYIEGLNHEKFSEVTELPLELIQSLLFQITKDQVKTIHDHVSNDSLVIIDELQDFFPSGRDKLSPEITEFVTQHRHRGLDVIVMGQDYRDCHNLWKRRIDQLYQFTKRDAVGYPLFIRVV